MKAPKRCIAAILLGLIAVTTLAQTTEQLLEMRKQQQQQDMEAMRKQMDATVNEAQKRAVSREINLMALATKRTNTTPLVKTEIPVAVFNTNATPSQTLAVHIMLLERQFPGISTNFTDAQRNFPITKPIIFATRDKDGKLVRLSTNYPAISTKGSK